MTEQKYAFQGFGKENMARACLKNLAISTKKSIEICSFIRGKTIKKAREALNKVLEMKDAVPYRRFNQEMAHNIRGPSGYPVKAITEILKAIKAAEDNAKAKGLSSDSLKIIHICAHRGPKNWHYGRQRRRIMKRTHIEIVVQDTSGKKKDEKHDKKADVKKEEKKEVKSKEKTEKGKVEKKEEKKTEARKEAVGKEEPKKVEKEKPKEKNKEDKK